MKTVPIAPKLFSGNGFKTETQGQCRGETNVTSVLVPSPVVRFVSCIEFALLVLRKRTVHQGANFAIASIISLAEEHLALQSPASVFCIDSSTTDALDIIKKSQLQEETDNYYVYSIDPLSLSPFTQRTAARQSCPQKHLSTPQLLKLIQSIGNGTNMLIDTERKFIGRNLALVLRWELNSLVLIHQVDGSVLLFDPQYSLSHSANQSGHTEVRGATVSYFENAKEAVHMIDQIVKLVTIFHSPWHTNSHEWETAINSVKIEIFVLCPKTRNGAQTVSNECQVIYDPMYTSDVKNFIDSTWKRSHPIHANERSRCSRAHKIAQQVNLYLNQAFRKMPISHLPTVQDCSSLDSLRHTLPFALLECVNQLPILRMCVHPIAAVAAMDQETRYSATSAVRLALSELIGKDVGTTSYRKSYQRLAREIQPSGLYCSSEAANQLKVLVEQLDEMIPQLRADFKSDCSALSDLLCTISMRCRAQSNGTTNPGPIRRYALQVRATEMLSVPATLNGLSSLELSLPQAVPQGHGTVTLPLPLMDLPEASYVTTQLSTREMKERMHHCKFDAGHVDDEAAFYVQFQNAVDTWHECMPECSVVKQVQFPSPFYMYWKESYKTVIGIQKHGLKIPLSARAVESSLDTTGNVVRFCKTEAFTELVALWLLVAAVAKGMNRPQYHGRRLNPDFVSRQKTLFSGLPASTIAALNAYLLEVRHTVLHFEKEMVRLDESSDPRFNDEEERKEEWDSTLVHIGRKSNAVVQLAQLLVPNTVVTSELSLQLNTCLQRISSHHYRIFQAVGAVPKYMIRNREVNTNLHSDPKSGCINEVLCFAPAYFPVSIDWSDFASGNRERRQQMMLAKTGVGCERAPRRAEIGQMFAALEVHFLQGSTTDSASKQRSLKLKHVFSEIDTKNELQFPGVGTDRWKQVIESAEQACTPIELIKALHRAVLCQATGGEECDLSKLVILTERMFSKDQVKDSKALKLLRRCAKKMMKALHLFKAHASQEMESEFGIGYSPACMVMCTMVSEEDLRYSVCIACGSLEERLWKWGPPNQVYQKDNKAAEYSWRDLVQKCMDEMSFPVMLWFERDAIQASTGAFAKLGDINPERFWAYAQYEAKASADFSSIDEALDWCQQMPFSQEDESSTSSPESGCAVS